MQGVADFRAVQEYWLDAWQRSILMLDVLRERGNTFLDRIEGSDIVGLALRRHNILIASQAFPKANRVEVNAEAICVDVLATACAQ